MQAHRFIPGDSTCTQRGCHTDTRIQLGKMASASGLHCSVCHEFTAPVPKLATRDSAAGTLVPNLAKCSSCHQMKALLVEFDPAHDPHSATCGTCHDPHKQSAPADAKLTCASAACHANWRDIPFHAGPNHKRVAQECTTCHVPHHARVDASDCAGCHLRVRGKPGVRSNLPVPFDTTAAKERVSAAPPDPRPPRGKGDAPIASIPPAPADSFSHQRHKTFNCITCHGTRTGQSRLTFERPRGCQICHHQAPAQNDCRRCHDQETSETPIAVDVTVRVPGQTPRTRQVDFAHTAHQSLSCVECHTQSITLAPDSLVRTCLACHEKHHTAARDCATCHRTPVIRLAHAPPVQPHTACDNCHTPAVIARLTPDRDLCRTCHTDNHYPSKECTTCHFQSDPAAFQAHLSRTGT
jgi:hypothetical protein